MEKDISPEERLLRLIRGEKKRKSLKEGACILSEERSKIGSPKRLIPKITMFQIPQIKRLLWAVLIVSFAYLLVSFIWPIFFPKEIKISQAVRKEIKEEESKPESKPSSFYQEQITEHKIFGPSPTQTTTAPQELADSKGVETIKDFNLLGIISGENPQAIIEDKKTQKTYFLRQGESIGEFQLELIGDGKVTLNFYGQKFDLFL